MFTRIDQTTSINEKIDALVHYFSTADMADAIWCVALLSGRRPKRTVKSGELRDWCAEASNTPVWLLEESYHIVGDLAETISLLLPKNDNTKDHSLSEVMASLIALQHADEYARKAYIMQAWKEYNMPELFIFNKLITGGFRVGVSDKIIIKALARQFEIDENVVSHRLIGNWDAASTNLKELLSAKAASDDISKPYPFYLAYSLETPVEELGDVNEWQIERKFDGIRGQIIVRQGEVFVWSRGEDLMIDKFIEFNSLIEHIPSGTVIDGEILPMKDGELLPFHVMQTRIGRKNVSKKNLQEAPLVMVCYDLLENNGVDIRHLSMQERREMLTEIITNVKNVVPSIPLTLSPELVCADWEEVAKERLKARELGCEGLMLKRRSSEYKTGRRRGDWWKWKVDPLSIDGVMIYAQRGHGRRADLYTDFTFAVWDGDELVPFAKAYSGLTDKEMAQVDAWVKKNTKEKFGPVRSVTPQLVFEIGFEGINPSSRHKSGVALRFPRILRWRRDKPVAEASTKQDLLDILKMTNGG